MFTCFMVVLFTVLICIRIGSREDRFLSFRVKLNSFQIECQQELRNMRNMIGNITNEKKQDCASEILYLHSKTKKENTQIGIRLFCSKNVSKTIIKTIRAKVKSISEMKSSCLFIKESF